MADFLGSCFAYFKMRLSLELRLNVIKLIKKHVLLFFFCVVTTLSPIQKSIPNMNHENTFLNNLVTGCSLPLSIVASKCLCNFNNDLNCKYVWPSRSQLRLKLISEVFAAKAEIIAKKTKSFNHLAITVNIWTGIQSYIACTANAFVDEKLHNFL